MRYLAIAGWVAAALGWYESYASTGRAPTIAGIGKGAVRHFRPHCPGCRCDQYQRVEDWLSALDRRAPRGSIDGC
jgi:hypothetical protein